MFDAPVSKPQSVGDLIGRAFRLYRVNIPLFVQMLMWPTIICIVGKVGLQWGITTLIRSNFKDPGLIIGSAISIFIGLIVFLISSFFLSLRQLAFVRMVNGFSGGYKEAYQFVKDKSWSIIGLFIIGYMLAVGIFVVWMIEFVISALLYKSGSLMAIGSSIGMLFGVLGLIFSTLVFSLVGFLVFCVLACENESLSAVILRGFGLTMRDFGRAVLFGVLLLLVVSALSYPLSLPVMLLSLFEFFRNGVNASEALTDPTKMPLYLVVLSQAWESLVNMLLWPVTYLAYGLLYYDLRVRQEGLDVQQNLRLLEHKSA